MTKGHLLLVVRWPCQCICSVGKRTPVVSSWPYRRVCKEFSHRHSELIVKYNIGLRTLLQQGISETVFNGDLLLGPNYWKAYIYSFNDQFKKDNLTL